MPDAERNRLLDDGGGLFLDLPHLVAERFAALSRRRQLTDGELLYGRGDNADELFGLIRGRIRLSNVAPEGREILVVLFEPGDWIGDLALFDGLSRTHNANSIGESEVFVLPKAKFQALLDSDPKLYRHFVSRLSRALRVALSYIDDAALLPLGPRVAKRLIEMMRLYGETTDHGVCLHLTQEDIARMLGVSRQSMSRELNHFQKQGWIELQYSKVLIRNEAALKRLVKQASDT